MEHADGRPKLNDKFANQPIKQPETTKEQRNKNAYVLVGNDKVGIVQLKVERRIASRK